MQICSTDSYLEGLFSRAVLVMTKKSIIEYMVFQSSCIHYHITHVEVYVFAFALMDLCWYFFLVVLLSCTLKVIFVKCSGYKEIPNAIVLLHRHHFAAVVGAIVYVWKTNTFVECVLWCHLHQ